MKPNEDHNWMTAEVLAAKLGVSVRTLRRTLRPKIGCKRISPRRERYTIEHLRRAEKILDEKPCELTTKM